jgi:uncharacterized protein
MKSETIRRVLIACLSASTLLTIVSSSAVAQSFDCRKATTAVEKMVCADIDLSKLDEQMARAFTDARGNVDVNVIGQGAWLKNVRNRCANVDCLKDAYEGRIAHLKNLSPVAATSGSGQLSSAAAFSIEGLAGEWTRVGVTQHDSSTLIIKNMTTAGFGFDVSAFSGAHSGEIEGVAVRNAAEAVFKDEETRCEVRFSRKSDHLFISTSEECLSMGGIGVTFDGEYGKGKVEAQTPTLAALGILAGNVTENAFSALVGKDYELFLSRFHLRSDQDDLDGLGAKVVSGGVRGLYTSMEAIVMSRPDGTILAAVIDDDVVKYFSNDANFKEKLPVTIDKWRERFAEKKVIFASVK